jgi:hypothetical protein
VKRYRTSSDEKYVRLFGLSKYNPQAVNVIDMTWKWGHKLYFCNTFIRLKCVFLSNHKFSTIIALLTYIVQNSLHYDLFVNVLQYCLSSGNSCYHSVKNLLSSHQLSKNVKIQIYETVSLPVVLYGCGTWSLTLKEEYRLRVFEEQVTEKSIWT